MKTRVVEMLCLYYMYICLACVIRFCSTPTLQFPLSFCSGPSLGFLSRLVRPGCPYTLSLKAAAGSRRTCRIGWTKRHLRHTFVQCGIQGWLIYGGNVNSDLVWCMSCARWWLTGLASLDFRAPTFLFLFSPSIHGLRMHMETLRWSASAVDHFLANFTFALLTGIAS